MLSSLYSHEPSLGYRVRTYKASSRNRGLIYICNCLSEKMLNQADRV